MAGLVTKVIFAVSTAGAVGGTYRLVSHYKNNTEPNSSVAFTNNSEQGVAETSSSTSLGVEAQRPQEESVVSRPNEHSREEDRQEPKQEVEVGQAEEEPAPSDVSTEPEQREASELPRQVMEQPTYSSRVPVESGKCKVVDTSANTLQATIINQQDYYTIFCDNGDSGDVSLPSKWTGLFPKSIFKKDMGLNVEQQLNIELKTDMDSVVDSYIVAPKGENSIGVDPWYGMTATSNKFSSETMTGYWGYKTFDEDNSGAIVVIDNPKIDQEIYLLFSEEE